MEMFKCDINAGIVMYNPDIIRLEKCKSFYTLIFGINFKIECSME